MEVRINGETRTLPGPMDVAALVAWLGVKAERVAVERNRLVVRRAEWAVTQVQPGDELEVLTFVGGG